MGFDTVFVGIVGVDLDRYSLTLQVNVAVTFVTLVTGSGDNVLVETQINSFYSSCSVSYFQTKPPASF